MKRAFPTGIRRLATSFQTYFDHAGHQYTATFPLETPLATMKEARKKQIAQVKYGIAKDDGRTFRKDADAYLAMVTAMPSYQDRKYHIDQWADAFGPRTRASITAAEIRGQLERWRTSGSVNGGKLSAGSLNRRRTALMAMFTALDGKSQPNIVKDVPRYDERASHQIRARTMREMSAIRRHVPPNSLSRHRLTFLQWTGLTEALLMEIRESDIDWDRKRVQLARRKKGHGLASAFVPLLPPALRALRRLTAAKALRAFSTSGLHSTWHRACDNAGKPRCRVYDLKHSFATWAASRIKDDRALTELLRTKSIARYTDAATPDRLTMALRELRFTGLQEYSPTDGATRRNTGQSESRKKGEAPDKR